MQWLLLSSLLLLHLLQASIFRMWRTKNSLFYSPLDHFVFCSVYFTEGLNAICRFWLLNMILTSVCNGSPIAARCRLGNRTRTYTTTTMILIAAVHASDAHVFMTVELFMPIGLCAHLIAYHRIKYIAGLPNNSLHGIRPKWYG